MNENFHYFALYYLNQWCEEDQSHCRGVNGSARSQRESLYSALKSYKVARNFKKYKMDGEAKVLREVDRMAGALAALNEVAPIDQLIETDSETAATAVSDLTEKLYTFYGTNLLSAASKMLWFRCKSPIKIYDSRAINTLRDCADLRCNALDNRTNYEAYLNAWKNTYERYRDRITEANQELPSVRVWSLGASLSDGEFQDLIKAPWFSERVFDMFLWFNG